MSGFTISMLFFLTSPAMINVLLGTFFFGKPNMTTGPKLNLLQLPDAIVRLNQKKREQGREPYYTKTL